jgi:8-oxo-dGTP pyrophosphatase MutT (NUDIX family)
MSRTIPRILNPQAAPVVEVHSHLPPVDSQALSAEALRLRFKQPPEWTPEHLGDGRLFGNRARTDAAVLVPLVQRDAGLQVLLTRRTEHLRDHAGQISFPGGRVEAGDLDLADTALREAEEEVGLPRSHVEVIGSLPHYTTVTHFVVTPVVALVRPGFQLTLDPFEVAEAFEVPLQFLMTPAHHRCHEVEFQGDKRRFLSMPWQAPGAGGTAQQYFIWGATAAMLRNLYRFLSR